MPRLPLRLRIYIAIIAVLAIGVAAGATLAHNDLPSINDWAFAAALAVLVAVCVKYPLHLAPKVATDMGPAPIVAGLLLLPGPAAFLAVAVGSLAGETFKSRKRPAQTLFNGSATLLAAAVGSLIYGTVGASGHLAGELATGLGYFAAYTCVIEGIIALQIRQRPFRRWWSRHAEPARHELSLVMIGILAVHALTSSPWVLPLIAVPCLVVYRSLRVQRDSLSRVEAGLAVVEGERGRLAAVLETTTDMVVTADVDGEVQFMNRTGRGWFELAALGALPSLKCSNLIPDWLPIAEQARSSGSWSGEATIRRGSPGERPVSLVVLAHRALGDAFEFFSLVARDISDRKALEASLVDIARRDALTGVLNRLAFEERLREELSLVAGVAGEVGLLYIDLDGFKRVNDTRGHAAGDELLRDVATALNRVVADRGVVARLGGDEFAVVLPASGFEPTERVAGLVRDAIRAVGVEAEVSIDASIGIAVSPAHGRDVDSLVRQADAAMYRAKHEAPGSVRRAEAA